MAKYSQINSLKRGKKNIKIKTFLENEINLKSKLPYFVTNSLTLFVFNKSLNKDSLR